MISRCEFPKTNFAHHCARCENFRTVRNPSWHTSAIFAHLKPFSHRAKQGAKFRTPDFKVRKFRTPHLSPEAQRTPHDPAEKPLESRTVTLLHFGHGEDQRRPFRSPSSPTPRPHRVAMGAAASPPEATHGPCATSRSSHELCFSAPAKRTKFSGPGEPSHAPQPEPPTEDSRIPVGLLRDRYQASHDSWTTDRGQLGLQRSILPSETYFDIEALRQQPELRDSFRLLQRYHMEDLLTPRQFYYPRVVIDFYQSMTTRGLRNPTLIQFTIDGRQGAIGARHIAEALRIPYEPVIQADFREWSSFSQSDMVRILSRGTSTASVLTRRELPSGMLLIDVLLRANLSPFSTKFRGRSYT
ncbi:hypothetical protein CK203_113943 [Vitis vinifera]|uniref:Uncharacterized protein n=1 Tax=Vitis vinifera TaxID=29760 RepID=A0A438DDX2_VITVI|nr:hypothetical protein CK203_113943 [Vitis vinifera]